MINYEKPVYKSSPLSSADPTIPGKVWSAKIDGARTNIQMEKDKTPLLFSHRISKRTNEPIPYTQKMTHIFSKSKVNANVVGETFAIDARGQAVHPDVITSILNSSMGRSLELQRQLGIKTQTALIDVNEYDGKDVRNWPFRRKRALLERIAKSNKDFILPDTAYTQSEKENLLQKIVSGAHPQTKEGIVEHDLDNPGEPLRKIKKVDHHDVVVRGVFPEENVKPGRQPMAGGFTYSWVADGPIMGRVGTGFNHAMKKDMMENPDKYVGMTAKVKALDLSKNRVLVKPSFDGFHVEKNIKEASAFFRGFTSRIR